VPSALRSLRADAVTGIVLLHGWPGGPSDFDDVLPLLPADEPVLVPDLFADRPTDVSANALANRVLGQIGALGFDRPVVAGYDIGSRIAQALARRAPEAVQALVLTPGYPGLGERPSVPELAGEFWYQHFNRLPLADAMLDGNRQAVAAYLAHLWTHWAASPGLVERPAFAELVRRYAEPGAFGASLEWYRQNRSYAAEGPVPVPATVLWAAADPLFPVAWADALGEWFTRHELRVLPGVGHFVPVEAPAAFAQAIAERLSPAPTW
jgi:pimeloyl-ACP methyl ester carboxylesterase